MSWLRQAAFCASTRGCQTELSFGRPRPHDRRSRPPLQGGSFMGAVPGLKAPGLFCWAISWPMLASSNIVFRSKKLPIRSLIRTYKSYVSYQSHSLRASEVPALFDRFCSAHDPNFDVKTLFLRVASPVISIIRESSRAKRFAN